MQGSRAGVVMSESSPSHAVDADGDVSMADDTHTDGVKPTPAPAATNDAAARSDQCAPIEQQVASELERFLAASKRLAAKVCKLPCMGRASRLTQHRDASAKNSSKPCWSPNATLVA